MARAAINSLRSIACIGAQSQCPGASDHTRSVLGYPEFIGNRYALPVHVGSTASDVDAPLPVQDNTHSSPVPGSKKISASRGILMFSRLACVLFPLR